MIKDEEIYELYEDVSYGDIEYSFKEFKKPENQEIKIWRYMDFTKFVSLLKDKALYFCRADKFEDKYEGKIPLINYDITLKEYTERFKKDIESQPSNLAKQIHKRFLQTNTLQRDNEEMLDDDELVNELAKHNTENLYGLSEYFRIRTFINCWHMNDYESMAMWKIYAKNFESVAIQSTYKRLEKCYENTDLVKIGIVTYIDFNKEIIPINEGVLSPNLYKTKYFEYENELRAITFGGNDYVGTSKEVDLNDLIECIYISPTAPEWFEDLVKSVMNVYGVQNIEVKKSDFNGIKTTR